MHRESREGICTSEPPPIASGCKSIPCQLYMMSLSFAVLDLPAQANRGGNETLTDITFNGGIEVCQLVNDQSMDYGKMWKIRWEPGQYDQVNVQEFQRMLILVNEAVYVS